MVTNAQETKTGPAITEVLTLDDIAPIAGIVRIDGASYDLANTRTFGLRRRAELQQLLKRIEVLERAEPEQLTEADEAEYAKRLRQVAAIALPSATEILGTLTDAQIGDVVVAFFVWAATNDPRMKQVRTLISLMPSPGSSGSMAATR